MTPNNSSAHSILLETLISVRTASKANARNTSQSLHKRTGMRPSIACTDPSSNNHNCSCTCTNGIVFEQPLPSPSQADGSNGPSLVDCQAGKNECLVREQGLVAELKERQQEHLKREREWLAREQGLIAEVEERQQKHLERENELSIKLKQFSPLPFEYQGCFARTGFTGSGTLTGGRTMSNEMTISQCKMTCKDFAHFAIGGVYCWCGDDLTLPKHIVGEEECNLDCSGDRNQKCGGSHRSSVYSKKV
jgi:hypothetical protein